MYHLKNEAFVLELLNHKEMITEHKEITLDLIFKSLSKTLTDLLKDKGTLISHIKASYEHLGQTDTQILTVTPIPLDVDEQSLENIYWIMIAIDSNTVTIYLSDEIYKFINNKTLMYRLFELEKYFLFSVYNKQDKNFLNFNIDYVENAKESLRIYMLTYYRNTDHKEIALISYDKTENDEVIIRPIYEEDLNIKMDIKTLYQIAKEMIVNKNKNALAEFIKDAINHEMKLDDEDQIQINVEVDLENLDHDELNDLEYASDPLADTLINALKTEVMLTDEEVDELFKHL